MTANISCYECFPKGLEEWSTKINSSSRGKAKSEYFRSVSESWDNIKFTDILCRKIGGPFTSEAFKYNAQYRGMPDLKCGQRVSVGSSKEEGVIVGSNASANFSVLFSDDSKYSGLTLSVHPCDIIEVA